jgi:hypothetical protein
MIKTIQRPTLRRTKKASKLASAYVIEYPTFYTVFSCVHKASTNTKTGDMIQTYFISKSRINEHKIFGAKCETCPIVNECYVSRDKLAVRRALKRLCDGLSTSYQWSTLDQVLKLITGRKLRFGTYGDPSVLPLEDVAKITSVLTSWTGYTHYWKEIDQGYSAYFMASVESLEGELLASSLGYRFFRVLLKKDEVLESMNSIECPNTTRGITCAQCGLCKGTSSKGKSIYIHEH